MKNAFTKSQLVTRNAELVRQCDLLLEQRDELAQVLSLSRDFAADISLVSPDGVLNRPTIAKMIDAVLSKTQSERKFRVGLSVEIDGQYMGEILHNVSPDFWRVEVDAEKPTHEFWTVKEDRMIALTPEN